jgi:WhiB family transcriptional regulator, redox-sensing transcriptional regulator
MNHYPVPADVRTPCQDTPDLFFSVDPHRIAQAKQICRTCPHAASCAEWATTRGEEGVWGATTGDERSVQRRRRGIATTRPPTLIVPRAPRTTVDHGTAVGVDRHHRKYQPLCAACEAFVAARTPDRAPCPDCGVLLARGSVTKHKRHCNSREQAAS